ncbi:MAG TPA: tetratricopeptide repeat protein [Thermoanaerobaculia bacterium]
MVQAATNPKIEELRFRLKSDPKSRLFYPLAEELRKFGQVEEAENVLHTGLAVHPTYLSAWVSLGRVLRDEKKNTEAVEALNKAMQLDPANVVAARLLADAYLALGEKVEAIKKYKLVYALLPADENLEATIARLDAEINAAAAIPEPEPVIEPPSAAPEQPVLPAEPEPFAPPVTAPPFEAPRFPAADERVFDETGSSILKRQEFAIETGDAIPMRADHAESPFEEPGVEEGYGTDAFDIEQPVGMHIASSPLSADLAAPLPFEPFAFEPQPPESVTPPEPDQPAAVDAADVFEPADTGLAAGIVTEEFAVTPELPPLDEADFARTIRMADLYASEGLIAEARDIYEDLLARDPRNESIRAKLEALSAAAEFAEPAQGAPSEAPQAASPPGPSRNPKVEKLESWLARVKRGEVGRV